MGAIAGLAVACGLGGFDPFSALLLAAALVGGASKRAASAMVLALTVGTIAVGMMLAGGASRLLPVLQRWLSGVPLGAWEVLAAACGGVLLFSAWRRWGRPETETFERKPRAVSTGALALVGVGLAAVVMFDPPFTALAIAAGARHSLAVAFLAQVIFLACSQFPLYLLYAALLSGNEQRAIAMLHQTWRRHRSTFRVATTLLIALAGLALIGWAGSEWALAG